MSLKSVRACVEALVEKVEHLEEDALKNCHECTDPIKAEEISVCESCSANPDCVRCKETIGDEAWCNNCGAPPDCDGCGCVMTSGFCPGCKEQEVTVAEARVADHYPVQGIPPVGELQDQLLTFLVVLAESCGCSSRSKRCVRCDDAMRLRGLYTEHLGEIRA